MGMNLKYLLVIALFTNCNTMEQENLTGRNVEIYKNTPVWEVAIAIRDNDTAKVKKLLEGKPGSFLNYKEKHFGQTLLNWAVYRDSYAQAKVLIELGANPNIKSNDSTTALINAADKSETSEFLSLLLKNGGNPNAVADIEAPQRIRTPLIAASFNRLESVKLLIEAGADPNYIHRSKRGNIGGENIQSALISAFRGDKIEIIKYLLIDVGVDFDYVFNTTLEGESLYILTYLRGMPFPLDSEEHKIKMEVVKYLKDKGFDYWKEPIPQRYYKQYDKSYLEKY
jgi:uncharacterized protein